jgi:Ca-activated chloride channel family protein
MTTIDPTARAPRLTFIDDDGEVTGAVGALESTQGALPLTGIEIDADLVGLYARVTLVQRFRNPHTRPIEAVYVFPLPDRASVHACVAELGGRRVEAQLKERSEAREEYFDALAAGKRAALAEEDRPEVFTISVGNVAPNEDATVTLELSMPLALDDDEATFRFPLVVAPRYVPGTPIDGGRAGEGTADDTEVVPDASRITPPLLAPGASPLAAAVRVLIDDAGLGVREVASTLHAASIEQSDGVTTLDLRARADCDLVIRYRIDEAARLSAVAVEDDERLGGVVTVNVVSPPADDQGPRDVAILLDRSGSMDGWKIVAARRAAARIVDSLGANDRVWVSAFDTVVETAPATPALVPATDRVRYRSVEFLARIDARGGTELAKAIKATAKTLARDRDRDRILVLVTDGQAADEDQLVQTVARNLRGVHVVAVGIDEAVNAGLLRRLAANGGACEFVESEDRLDEVLTRIVRRVATPSVTDLSLEVEGGTQLDRDTLAPVGEVDAAPGARATLAVRYTGARPTVITVTGTRADGSAYRETIPVAHTTNAAPRRAWARMRLRDLEDDAARGADTEKQLVALSLAEGVLCRYTAFVAVDEEGTEVQGPTTTVVQPVAMPAGWHSPPSRLMVARTHVAGDAYGALAFSRDMPDASPTRRSGRSGEVRGPVDPVLAALAAVQQCNPDATVMAFTIRVLDWRMDPAVDDPEKLRVALDDLIDAQRAIHGDNAPVVEALEELRAALWAQPAGRKRRQAFWK